MLSRLFPLFRDEALTIVGLIIMMSIQFICLLIFSITPGFIFLLAILFLLDILAYLIEKKLLRLNLIRFINFLILFLVSLIFSSGSINLAFNDSLLSGLQVVVTSINPFSNLNITGMHLIIILSGLFFLLNESNFLIRLIFEMSGKLPVTKETHEPDKKELNAGRMIGILERILIFFFVIIGQFAAVGFVIAAKGVVRYKELEDRNFAEYVLIGTLLSSLLSMFTGFIAAHLII